MSRPIDLCIVAGRRPDLLGRTLSSFREKLLDQFEIVRVIANIDPVFGDEQQADACRTIIRDIWPYANVTMPSTPGFCSAIKRNWAATKEKFVFHLEDDWDLNETIHPSILDRFEEIDVAQIILHSWYMEWPVSERGRYCEMPRHERLMGIRMPWKRMRPMFPTSPSFFRGDFVRMVAERLDVRFDADRQMREWKLNSRLVKAVTGYRSYIHGDDDNFPITDTGREWRKQRDIQKLSAGGASVWTN